MRSLIIPISALLALMLFAGCTSPVEVPVVETVVVEREVVVEKEIPGIESLISEWEPVVIPPPVTVVAEPVQVPVPQTVIVEKELVVERDVPVTVVVEKEVLVEKDVPVTVVTEKVVEVQLPVPQTVIVEKEVVVEKEVPVTVVTEKVVEVQLEVPQTVIVEKEVMVEKEVPVTVTAVTQNAPWQSYNFLDYVELRKKFEDDERFVYIRDVCKGYPEQELTDEQHLLLWQIRFGWWIRSENSEEIRRAHIETRLLTNAQLCTDLG